MKKQLQLGLVVEGNATASAVLRVRNLAEELGPVKSVGLQVARRISNFLRAGYAVTEYKDLDAARLILLRLPDDEVPRIVAELCEANLPFGDLSFVLCESWLMTDVLAPLRAQGCAVASLVTSPGIEGTSFVVEGDAEAVRLVRRFLERGGQRTIELRPGTKPLYFAASVLLLAIPVPLFHLAQQALRDCGISGNHLTKLMGEMSERLFDTVQKGARVTWGGPLAESSNHTVEEYFQRLRGDDAKLAKAVDELLAWSRAHLMKRARGQSV